MGKPRSNLAGKTFGRLTAIEYAGGGKWRCSCLCGGERTTATSKLTGGDSISCGCVSVERFSVINRKRRRVAACECGDHVFTDLTRGFVGIVSPEDRPLFDDASWNAHRSTKGAWSVTGTYAVKLHRVIMGVDDPKIMVDHKNGDTFDNRRSNLRLCCGRGNAKNQGTRRNKVHSKFKGVTKIVSATSPWLAQIVSNGRRYALGLFPTEEDAARAYDEAALRLHGEFARTNRSLGLL